MFEDVDVSLINPLLNLVGRRNTLYKPLNNTHETEPEQSKNGFVSLLHSDFFFTVCTASLEYSDSVSCIG
jgi:hypothetical protein